METFLEILKYILPSLIMFGALYFVMNRFLDTEHRKQLLVLRQENQKITTPLRLQAYERLVLFLERISMDKLVLRVNKPGMSAKLLKSELLRTIQKEFEHNLTQQLYTSNTSWDTVKKAKDESLKIVNLAGVQMKPDANGAELGQKIFEIMLKLDKSPSQIAVLILKKEIRQLF
ncbi:MAG: hypothetical protein JKX68_01330 [Flavobacteriales bacterium]|nr:hypothetical protein [Flavobacteriales bacterium]